ncbi:membrane-spanning 4-domains subfamily A member 8-like [Erpetoichthys calabaricus]|uniref:Membrane-spanning 4-domains subfamily A member 8-like n=1 Tax=Erpetoichthys calabaricus TaxID=27687 RepID=A0A8C4SSW3_ERPCA|nr:membrane-spanning 4-domains subfamily A member 8-like [Erpetoichthys calabaricus]
MEKRANVIQSQPPKTTADQSVSPVVTATCKSENLNKIQLPKVLNTFQKGELCILGILQLTSGIVNIVFGFISVLSSSYSLADLAFPFWTGLLYIVSGSLTIEAGKNPKASLMRAMLIMNIISAVAAVIGVFMYSFVVFIEIHTGVCPEYDDLANSDFVQCKFEDTQIGIIALMLIFTILESFVSIITSSFGCRFICCHNLPVIVIQQHLTEDSVPDI